MLTQEEQDRLWQELEERSFSPEIDSREPGERSTLEAGINAALSTLGQEGWDFDSDHYRPPSFVCRFTLLNKRLHGWDIIHSVLEVFDSYPAPWVLDLGLVDAIEGNLRTKCDDLARLIVTHTEILVDGVLGLAAVPTQLWPKHAHPSAAAITPPRR